jgi:N-acetylmuramic acid 6-phosphate etherase
VTPDGLDLGQLGHAETLSDALGRRNWLREKDSHGKLRRVTAAKGSPDRRVFDEIAALATEQRNPRTMDLDTRDVPGILRAIHAEDRTVADVVGAEIPRIARVVEMAVESLRAGGRLIYVGAGTSGRLGVLDAAECPPTFGTPIGLVRGIIAGGPKALVSPVEGAEDREAEGRAAIRRAKVGRRDLVIGIAASRRTPFVQAALAEARSRRAKTALICCTPLSAETPAVDVAVSLVVGPEALMGSTRMKAGTATKLALNMISTATMVRLGKVYENMMVDLMATSRKLVERGRRTLMTVSGIGYEEACVALERASGSVKTAIVMVKAGVTRAQAEKKLRQARGFVRAALEGTER